MLIGFTAPARSGKDTAAAYLAERYGFTQTAFATSLKQTVQTLFRLDDTTAFDDLVKDVPVQLWGLTPRELWCLTSKGLKEVFGDDLFIRLWLGHLTELEGEAVVVSDVRTEAEAAMVRELGGVIVHIARPDAPALQGAVAHDVMHRGVQFKDGDRLLFNDAGLDELFDRLDILMEEF